MYLGDIFFGSPTSQSAKLVFDTGSNWLTVTSDACSACDIAYVRSQSSTAM